MTSTGVVPVREGEAEAGDDEDDQDNHDTRQIHRVQVKPTCPPVNQSINKSNQPIN